MKKSTLFFSKNATAQKKNALFLHYSDTISFDIGTSAFFTVSFSFGKAMMWQSIEHILQEIDHVRFYSSIIRDYVDTAQNSIDLFLRGIRLILLRMYMKRKNIALFFECIAHIRQKMATILRKSHHFL